MTDATQNMAVVAAEGVKVHFGAVKALDGVDLVIAPGECVGLVGHNGAGKSTIVNVINGGLAPHEGAVRYGGRDAGSGIAVARANGVRCVFQELSLCPNLTVVENTRVMHAELKGFGWRGRALGIIQAKLDEIFPGHNIDCTAAVGDLSIAERQMVEISIAFATVHTAPRLVILDEPTSSLDAGLAAQLMDYVRRFVSGGGAVLLISHILGEILSTASRVVVMKDGKVVANRLAADFDIAGLVQAMGNVVKEQARRANTTAGASGKALVDLPAIRGRGLPFRAHKGEVIGLAGLAGHGQTDMLLALFHSLSSGLVSGARPRRRLRCRRPQPERHIPALEHPQQSLDLLARELRFGGFRQGGPRSRTRRGLEEENRDPHTGYAQRHSVALRRQPAEGAVWPRACDPRGDGADG